MGYQTLLSNIVGGVQSHVGVDKQIAHPASPDYGIVAYRIHLVVLRHTAAR